MLLIGWVTYCKQLWERAPWAVSGRLPTRGSDSGTGGAGSSGLLEAPLRPVEVVPTSGSQHGEPLGGMLNVGLHLLPAPSFSPSQFIDHLFWARLRVFWHINWIPYSQGIDHLVGKIVAEINVHNNIKLQASMSSTQERLLMMFQTPKQSLKVGTLENTCQQGEQPLEVVWGEEFPRMRRLYEQRYHQVTITP